MIVMKRWIALGLVFILSFCIRYIITALTPERNTWIDLCIYIDGGQLIANGINPYDYNDEPLLRDSLRTDSIAFDHYVAESQDRWNFYASGNLPLTLLYFGAIEQIAQGDPFIYRVVFSFMDAILSVILTMFISTYWITNEKYKFLVAIGLGTLSPILLSAGTFLPEDKGVQILLMVGAIYFSKKKDFFPATLLLGWSVAFKGLGVFIAPVCLYYYLGEIKRSEFLNVVILKRSVLFTLAALIIALQPFIFYLSDIVDMMKLRLSQNLGSELPEHSSIWVFTRVLFPNSWMDIKFIFSLLFVSINLIGILLGKLSVNIVTASVLIWFTIIMMISGSVDRLNIAMSVGIVLLGASHTKGGIFLTMYYVFAGIMSLAYVTMIFQGKYALPAGFGTDTIASPFCLGFVIAYTLIIAYYSLKDYHFRWGSRF
jgi:hypothetical protein